MIDENLVARVDELETVPFRGVAFRHVSPGTDPRSGTGARIHGGRWNPPDSFQTVYLGLDVATASAEFHRAAARQGLRPEDFVPRELHTFEVSLSAVIDLRKESELSRVALTLRDIERTDPRACQLVGEAAQYLGAEGLLAPSATGVGSVLVVFLGRLRADSIVESRGYDRWEQPPNA